MCHQTVLLAKNYCGELYFCEKCLSYDLAFNNIHLKFSSEEMNYFSKLIELMQVRQLKLKHPLPETKIPMKTLQQNLCLVFDKKELIALRQLLAPKAKSNFTILNIRDIDLDYSIN
jgi:hypothetical protein